MPNDATRSTSPLLLIGPDVWAFRVELRIQDTAPWARCVSCTSAMRALEVLQASQPLAMIAFVSGGASPTGLEALASSSAVPPLLIMAARDAHAGPLVELMMRGAAGLIREDDNAGLERALRRLKPKDSPPTAPGADSSLTAGSARASAGDGLESLRTLADRDQAPLLLVRDEAVVHANPAFRALLGLSAGEPLDGRPLSDFTTARSAKTLRALLARADLLDVGDGPREQLELQPPGRAPLSVQVSSFPLGIGGRDGLALSLSPSSGGADGRDVAPAEEAPRTRAALLDRLSVLTDENTPVERSSLLLLATLANFGEQRARLGFAGSAALMNRLARCLRDAASADSTVYLAADDMLALLIEDVNAVEVDRLRRRIIGAPGRSEDAALTALRLDIGTGIVTPGVVSAQQILDRVLAQTSASAPPTAALPATSVPETILPETILPPTETPATEPSPDLERHRSRLSLDISEVPASEFTALSESIDLRDESRPLAPAAGGTAVGTMEQYETMLQDPLLDRIDRALANQGFVLAFQPIISLVGDSREHYSVLLRLREADGSLTNASRILAAAAGSERMAEIDRWMLRCALERLGERRKAGEKAAFFLSLSPEIVRDDQLLIWICDAMREFDVRGNWLTFQTRQQDVETQPELWQALAAGLREVKCRICVSPSTLRSNPDALPAAPPDFVKFPPSLTTHLWSDRDKQRQLLEMIQLANRHNIQTVVTGVPDSRTLGLVWDAGIEYVQGDYLCPPTLELELTEAIRAESEQQSAQSATIDMPRSAGR